MGGGSIAGSGEEERRKAYERDGGRDRATRDKEARKRRIAARKKAVDAKPEKAERVKL